MVAIALPLPFFVIWLIYFVLVQGMIKKTNAKSNGKTFNQFMKTLKQSDDIPQQNVVSEQAQIYWMHFKAPTRVKIHTGKVLLK